MTTSSHSHPHGAGTGAATKDEATVLAASAHLTDRDRDLVRLVAVHRVLTTGQLTALGFGNLTTARHRLSALVRLGLLRRFRPHPPIGSAPWHYVLGPTGAAKALAEPSATSIRKDGEGKTASPARRAHRTTPAMNGKPASDHITRRGQGPVEPLGKGTSEARLRVFVRNFCSTAEVCPGAARARAAGTPNALRP